MAVDAARVKSLFLAASEMEDAAERAAYLERECAGDAELRNRVEALLRASDPRSDAPTIDPSTETRAAPPPEASTLSTFQPTPQAGTVISNRYTLDQKIGEGGMGEVWVARQTSPVKRKVAIKLIKAGMDSRAVLQRFEQERQALALMDHPNIARVLDAGLTFTSQPFFVMELVNGLPLNKYCDAATLTPRQRLELFVPICKAVQHAHQKGIVHRDLKPANILVTMIDGRPVPKVIDFGVAKATSGKLTEETMSTSFGAVIGTLEYMSPEQAGFSGEDVDTRADIYSLGVILYELLTGLKPIDAERLRKAALAEMIRIIQVEEPSKPSTRLSTDKSLPSMAALRQTEPKKLTALLRGELDCVVMKCLEKQRDRRYDTANALVRDIERYLADEVVEARPPSAGYRLQKFVRRNKGQVIAASLVPIVLVGGIVGTSIGLVRAGIAGAREKAQREKAEGLATANAALADDESKARNKAEYQLGLSNILLANAAYDNADMRLADERLDLVPAEMRGWDWRYLKQQTRGGLFTMATRGPVTSVAFSPDGNRIASIGGSQQTPDEAKVWDARTGNFLFELKGLPVVDGINIPPQIISFSPDGTRILTAGSSGGVKLWDARTGAMSLDFASVTLNQDGSPDASLDWVQTAAFSPDGSRIVLTGNGSLQIRDAATGKPQFASARRMLSGVFSPDGSRILVCNEFDVEVLDARNGTVLTNIKGRDRGGQCAAFSPDGKRIIVGSDDGTATVADAQTGAILLKVKERAAADRVLIAPPQGIMSVSFSPDGTRILTGGGLWGHQAQATVWDALTGAELLDLKGHTDVVLSAVFSPDGSQIVTGSADATVKVWDAKTGTARLDLQQQKFAVNCVAFSPDGTQILTGTSDGKSDVEARFIVKNAPIGAPVLRSVAMLWDARTGTPRFNLIGPPGRINGVAFSPDGARIATVGADLDERQFAKAGTGHATIWDAGTGTALIELKGLQEGVNSVAFSPDGTRIVTGGCQGRDSDPPEVKLWDAQTGSLVLDMTPPRADGFGFSMNAMGVMLAFSPDGGRILVGGTIHPDSSDSDAKVVDAKTGKTLFNIKGHADALLSVAYSHDGTRIITTGADNLAKVWDAATGEFQMDLKGHLGPVNCAAFSPDGTRIVTGSADHSIRVWDARTGISLVELKCHAVVNGVSFSPDGSQIVSCGGGGTAPGDVIVWQAPARGDDFKLPPSADELERRKLLTQPNFIRYRESYLAARAAKDDFAAAFFLDLIPPDERKETLDEADAQALVALNQLARQDMQGNKLEEAIPLYVQLVDADKARLGPGDPATFLAAITLGRLYNTTGQPLKAIPVLEDAIGAQKAKGGPASPLALVATSLLAQAFIDAGRLPEAITVLEEGATNGLELTAQLLNAYEQAGENDKIVALCLKELAKTEKSIPEDDLQGRIGRAYLAQKQWRQAEEHLRACMALREKSAPDLWTNFEANSLLGAALLGQKNYTDAEPLLLKGYAGMKQRQTSIPPTDASRRPEAVDRLIDLYTATNQPAEAAQWQAERAKYAAPATSPGEKK